jgi:hypothetical protein
MKNIIVYYFVILVPFFGLLIAMKRELLSEEWCIALLVFYAFIYRTLTDYYRLKSKNAITSKQFFSLLIPGSRIKYFKELYFV